MYADVIIDISHEQLDKTFQYAVPDELVDVIELGMSVDIPFGAGNRQITGYVVGLGDKAAYPVEKIKYITGITEGKVTAVSRMLKLAAWLKHNYGCTMNQAIKTVIPVMLRMSVFTFSVTCILLKLLILLYFFVSAIINLSHI